MVDGSTVTMESRVARIEHMFASSGDPLDRYCADAVAAIDALAGHDPAMLDAAGQLLRLRTVSRLIDRLEAERVRLLRVADQSGALEEDGSAAAASWLQYNSTLTMSQACVRARLARRLSQLPAIDAEFARGDLGVNHVSLILGLCRDVGIDNVAAMEDEIVHTGRRLRTVEDFTQACREWRRALRSGNAETTDDRADDRRRSRLTPTAEVGPLRRRR